MLVFWLKEGKDLKRIYTIIKMVKDIKLDKS